MVARGVADPPEERPEWLPEGWSVCIKTRKNGKVDRFYVSPSGQKLRSKVEVIRQADKYKATSVEHEPVARSAFHSDDKHQPESEKSQTRHEDAPFSLPDGWIVETKIRKGGKSSGSSYKIYINPVTGFKCYSMKEVNRHVTSEKHSASVSRAKKSSALHSPDSVHMENEDSSMEQPSGLKSSTRTNKNKALKRNKGSSMEQSSSLKNTRTKKNEIAVVAATDNQSSAKRSSSTLRGDKVWAAKIKNVYEDRPYFQDVFPEESQEEAGDISESIDKIIRNLSQDLKIPDFSIAFSTQLEQDLDLVDQSEACSNSRPTVLQSTKQKKGKARNGLVGALNESSVDMAPAEKNGMSNGSLLLSADDKSDRRGRPSRLERKSAGGKQSKPADVDPPLQENKDSKLEDTNMLEEKTKKSKRSQEHLATKSDSPLTSDKKASNKTPNIIISSRASRRLAGRDAGPDAHAEINENDLRRNKRLRK